MTSLITKSLCSKRRTLFVSFQIVKDPMFFCAFDCATDTGNVSQRCDFVLSYPLSSKIWQRFTEQIIKSRTDKENCLLSINLWIVVSSIGVA